MKLFHARGYDAVGVAELSSALGIRPPSFYAAFGSKAGLFERALHHYAAGEGNVFAYARAQAHATDGTVGAVLERTLLRAAQIYPSREGAAGCLVLDGARNSADPEAVALTDALRKASHLAIRDFVAAHAVARAEEIADYMTITLLGMSAAARDGADETKLRAYAEIAGRTLRQEFGLD